MKTFLLLGALWMITCGTPSNARAEDKNGLRVVVIKKTLQNSTRPGDYDSPVNRTMALQATVQNISMSKDLPEGKISGIVLIESWFTESGAVKRYSSQVKLEPLRTSKEAKVSVGEYHIGGHMHGTSDRHADHVVGWKIIIEHDGKKTEFMSSPAFDALNKRAADAIRN